MASALVSLGQTEQALPLAEQALAFYESIGHEPHTNKTRAALAKWRASGSSN